MLNTTLYKAETPSDAPPLLIAHGLFGSARNWGVICRRLAETRKVIAVDMRNHGESPWTETHRYPDMAADLAEVIAAQGGQADVLGHSMGGKAAMALALTEPGRVRRLVVADVAPVAYSHDQMQNVDAMRSLDPATVATRGDADRKLAEVLPDAGLRAFFLQSLDLRADPPRWKLNLDLLAAEMPHIVGWPGIEGRFEGPALFPDRRVVALCPARASRDDPAALSGGALCRTEGGGALAPCREAPRLRGYGPRLSRRLSRSGGGARGSAAGPQSPTFRIRSSEPSRSTN